MKMSFKALCPFWGIFLLIEVLLEEGITLHLLYHGIYSSTKSNTTKQHVQFSDRPEMHKWKFLPGHHYSVPTEKSSAQSRTSQIAIMISDARIQLLKD